MGSAPSSHKNIKPVPTWKRPPALVLEPVPCRRIQTFPVVEEKTKQLLKRSQPLKLKPGRCKRCNRYFTNAFNAKIHFCW